MGRTRLTRKGAKDDKKRKPRDNTAPEETTNLDEDKKVGGQVARRSRREEHGKKRKKIMDLRQMAAALRKEKEAYEAVYVNSEFGSLRDEDSVRSNSLRRAMSVEEL